jgi:hypothetical protein
MNATIEGAFLVIRIPLSQFGTEAGKYPFDMDLRPMPQGFDWSWPKEKHHYENAVQGRATWRGRTYDVRIGSVRTSGAGREREYVLVVINGYPTLNFVEGDDGRYASIVTHPGSRATIRHDSELPAGYADASLSLADYHEVVQGPGASRARAVVVDSPTDHGPMIRHAILRWVGRQASANDESAQPD